MATRTAKGIVQAKASGTTLTLSSVSLTTNHAIFAIVGFQGSNVPTSVKAGAKTMTKVIQRVNSTASFGAAIYYKRVIRNGDTRDIVATWASAIGARVMAVITVAEPMLFFEGAGNIENTASPAPANEYDSELAAIQADLDNPDQYKANLTGVALEATLQLVKTETDKIPSLESLLAFISSIEGGRWKIENNQMIFYEDDNVTEVARFNLYDADGQPAETDIFERERV